MGMDPELSRALAVDTPKLNPILANGIAVEHLKEVENYVHQLLWAQSKGYPDGFNYIRCVRCTPQQKFDELTRKKKGSRRVYEIARANLFMVELIFTFHGKEIKRRISLPFTQDAGVIYLGGPRFTISPFLVDRFMSIERDGIFIPFGRGKVTFEREPASYLANKVQEVGLFTIHGSIFNRQANEKQSVKGKTTLIHYFFCKFGFEETFRRYVGTVPVFGTHEQINERDYPPEEWVICESRGLAPQGHGSRVWRPSLMRLAVRHEHYTRDMRNYIAGFFYILDLFPTRLDPKPEVLNHTGRWRVLMGHLINPPGYGEGVLHDKASDHVGSVDEYFDEIMRAKAADVGIIVEDIYHFFQLMIQRFEEWYLNGQDKINSLYGKELNVLDYVMSDVRIAINTFYFKLVAHAKTKRESGKELKEQDILNLMNKYLRTGKIYNIRKDHHEVTTTTTSGDNKAFRITSIMVPQNKAGKKNVKDGGAMNDVSKHLHVSIAEIGGYANMPKADPSGHSRLNLYAQITGHGVVLQNPSLLPILGPVQAKIKREI